VIKTCALLAVAAAVVACGGPPPPGSPSPFDGTYAGTAALFGFSAPDWQCDWTAPTITIRDGRFHQEIDGAPMTVVIAPDGSFDQYAARPVYNQTKYLTPVHLFGRIADGTMVATVQNPRCNFRLVMHRSPGADAG